MLFRSLEILFSSSTKSLCICATILSPPPKVKQPNFINQSLSLPMYHDVKIGLPSADRFRSRWMKKRPDAVSYTHLDVYKRQVMEVCGGQTHAIASLGLEELLPPGLRLIHGPGCPVGVTSVDLIDQAVELSLRPGVVLCSYGDMMRVPGSRGDLFSAKARGGDVLLRCV